MNMVPTVDSVAYKHEPDKITGQLRIQHVTYLIRHAGTRGTRYMNTGCYFRASGWYMMNQYYVNCNWFNNKPGSQSCHHNVKKCDFP